MKGRGRPAVKYTEIFFSSLQDLRAQLKRISNACVSTRPNHQSHVASILRLVPSDARAVLGMIRFSPNLSTRPGRPPHLTVLIFVYARDRCQAGPVRF